MQGIKSVLKNGHSRLKIKTNKLLQQKLINGCKRWGTHTKSLIPPFPFFTNKYANLRIKKLRPHNQDCEGHSKGDPLLTIRGTKPLFFPYSGFSTGYSGFTH